MADAVQSFKLHGVTVTLQRVESSALVPALQAGDVDGFLQSASPVITGDLNGKLDLVFVGSPSNHSPSSLMSSPTVQTAAELKGKAVATDRPGTPVAYSTGVELAQIGLQPTDVQLLPVGTSDATLAALLSGQVAAATLSPPQAFQAKAKGFNTLTDMYKLPYQGSGVVMSRAALDRLSTATLAFLQGLRDGVVAYPQQPELAMQLLSQYSGETDRDILQQTYEFYRDQTPFDPSLRPNLAGIRSVLEFLRDTVPGAAAATPEQFVDLRFVDRLST
jgi:ABC-type nitrate/sulfonate/bicarbonate transport system substrate-binding protein